ncbi:AAA family ATPase [Pseudomonas sp. MF6767]|jgi:putative ATP-dependent endonuclease of OLD family|uniref:ATP-dependent nuclease n=1 Tax=Pseudomonas sp. MF6767 TaxID=2797531 RepID=UPI0018E8A489|nr:AAA family ATPase [Pseudomonas sp. MF6767]MBJ2281151.1 AAA family ATPase [Pseudomonas sp. MF6767]
MYLSSLSIKNFRQFGDLTPGFVIHFNEGVTALVGENDAGKTAVIDAIRHVLQTRDSDFLRLELEDFHVQSNGEPATDITLVCTLSGLSTLELGAFAEYVTFSHGVGVLHVHWSARRLAVPTASRRWVDIQVRCGERGEGPALDVGARQLLATAYLKPLRDAEREMSPGRNSRLSQVLSSFPGIDSGESYVQTAPPASTADAYGLSIAGMGDFMRELVRGHDSIKVAQATINDRYLEPLSLAGQPLHSNLGFGDTGSETTKLKQILERLELGLLDKGSGLVKGSYGLGSNNLLFMACELLLLGKEPDGLPLLLIEEPEAHLHPQRQLRLMEFLANASQPAAQAQGQEPANTRAVQVILTTHSPNLSSKIALENLVLIHGQRAFSMAQKCTKLSADDYRFLSRFLDVTKASLFFAKGLLIVEGDAEAILLPALARLLERDLTKHGVSIVNVGGVGLRRYANIMQRADDSEGVIQIPTACITDMDVMPDCAPAIMGLDPNKLTPGGKPAPRRWKMMSDFGATDDERAPKLAAHRYKRTRGDGQNVKTFVANHWTLEYDLAVEGLMDWMHRAATLALHDAKINEGTLPRMKVLEKASKALAALKERYTDEAERATEIYRFIDSGSKSITAQHLVDLLEAAFEEGELDQGRLRAALPPYVVEAIEYATGGPIPDLTPQPPAEPTSIAPPEAAETGDLA